MGVPANVSTAGTGPDKHGLKPGTHTILYDPQGRIEALLPLDRAPYEGTHHGRARLGGPEAGALRLGVLSGEVGDAAGWGVAADSGVGSVVVVPVQPVGKRGLAFGF